MDQKAPAEAQDTTEQDTTEQKRPGTPIPRTPIPDIDRTMAYMHNVSSCISEIIPVGKTHKYCVVFGDEVIGTYDTLEEALDAQKSTWRFLNTLLYIPHVEEVTVPA